VGKVVVVGYYYILVEIWGVAGCKILAELTSFCMLQVIDDGAKVEEGAGCLIRSSFSNMKFYTSVIRNE
jgi:hypothetical protein